MTTITNMCCDADDKGVKKEGLISGQVGGIVESGALKGRHRTKTFLNP
jgi:hypothetical protein